MNRDTRNKERLQPDDFTSDLQAVLTKELEWNSAISGLPTAFLAFLAYTCIRGRLSWVPVDIETPNEPP